MIQAEEQQKRTHSEETIPELSKILKNLTGRGPEKVNFLQDHLLKRGVNMADLFHNFQREQIAKVIDNSEPVILDAKGESRTYEIYKQVPAIIVLEGCIEVSYTDQEGDRKKLDVIDCRLTRPNRMFEISRSLLASAIKQADLDLLTDFKIQNPVGVLTLILLVNNTIFEEALQARQHLHIARILRQRETLKHYGIQTESTTYTQVKLTKTLCVTTEHPYVLLLSGKLCIMKDTLLLSCYNEGLFSRVTNQRLPTKFVIVGGSQIIMCQSVWKNQKYQQGQLRRLKHLEAVIDRYKDMPEKQVKRLQKLFVQENQLDIKHLEEHLPKKKQLRPHQSLKEQSAVLPKLVKKLSQNSQNSQPDDLKSTKTSIEKCIIRIRVKKK